VGGRLLGPSSAAVRLTTDKLRLAEHLRARGVPTPPTVPCTPEAAALGFPLVVKPRDGAGSQATFLVRDAAELARCPARAAAEGWTGELVAQPFVEGEPASVSFVIGPGGKYCLKPARQLLSADGRLRYEGGVVPGADEKVAKAVAVRALAAVEGLRGWFGVDIVLQEQTGQLIEINPRLTTSYVGLRRLARCNLMELLLAAASGETPPVVAWRDGAVTFRPDGTISEG
jgi:predicted ATP-grasp superfamily ATP-dependent carboligase